MLPWNECQDRGEKTYEPELRCAHGVLDDPVGRPQSEAVHACAVVHQLSLIHI